MSFKKVENNQCYFKGVIYGDTGSGKTTLAEKIAIGLATKNKTVYVLDTEGGIDFFAKTFQEYNIECFVQEDKIKTIDSFNQNLKIAINEKPDVIIIDSISHIGELYQQEYVSSKDPKNSILNWGIAKKQWNVNVAQILKEARCNVIICGRETSGMAIEFKDGKKEITYSNPTKIKAGFDLDYELNILIQMSTATKNDKQVRLATILKDRSNKIDGECFINPTFDDIKPHLEGLGSEKKIEIDFEGCKNEIAKADNVDCLMSIQKKIIANKNSFTDDEVSTLRNIYQSKMNELEKM
jgi:adenylate kinase family enzyme